MSSDEQKPVDEQVVPQDKTEEQQAEQQEQDVEADEQMIERESSSIDLSKTYSTSSEMFDETDLGPFTTVFLGPAPCTSLSGPTEKQSNRSPSVSLHLPTPRPSQRPAGTRNNPPRPHSSSILNRQRLSRISGPSSSNGREGTGWVLIP